MMSVTIVSRLNLLSGSSLLCFAKSVFYCVLSHVAFTNHLFVWATFFWTRKRKSSKANFTVLKVPMVWSCCFFLIQKPPMVERWTRHMASPFLHQQLLVSTIVFIFPWQWILLKFTRSQKYLLQPTCSCRCFGFTSEHGARRSGGPILQRGSASSSLSSAVSKCRGYSTEYEALPLAVIICPGTPAASKPSMWARGPFHLRAKCASTAISLAQFKYYFGLPYLRDNLICISVSLNGPQKLVQPSCIQHCNYLVQCWRQRLLCHPYHEAKEGDSNKNNISGYRWKMKTGHQPSNRRSEG